MSAVVEFPAVARSSSNITVHTRGAWCLIRRIVNRFVSGDCCHWPVRHGGGSTISQPHTLVSLRRISLVIQSKASPPVAISPRR